MTLKAVEPTSERPPETTRPTFKWSAEPAPPGVTYDFVLWEVIAKPSEHPEEPAQGEVRTIFEQRGLRETELRYPESGPPLDKAKLYGWMVVANDSEKRQVGQVITELSFGKFPFPLCLLIVWPPNLSFCQQATGNVSANVGWIFWSNTPGSVTATLTDPNNNSTSVTGSSFPITWSGTQPGTFQWTLTVKKGTGCTRSANVTVSIYPSLQVQVLDYPTGNAATSLCWGDDATLKMVDVNGNTPPAGCQVKWEYSSNNGANWNALGTGNPFNTNPITSTNSLFAGLSCNGASINLQFRGTLDANCLNFTGPGWPAGCPNVKTASLAVDCPTQPGSVNIPQAVNGGICSNGNYPVAVTPILTGQTGTINGWSVNGNPIPNSAGQTNINYNIANAGQWQFCADVQNGKCTAKPACATVMVEDPIKGTIKVTQNGLGNQNPEVCWGDDKVTMDFVPSTPLPPGTLLSWFYQSNCTGPWTASGVTGTSQNSNDVLLAPFYPPNINPCNANNVCWKVTAKSPTGICPPVDIGPATITIVRPFAPSNPPIILPGTVPIKCPGTPVTLTASNLNCATGPPTFQWYLDGLPVAGATSSSIQAVDPGNYTVEVSNKNKCDTIETAAVTVRDCLTLVEIKGPCTCKDGDVITLTAAVSSQVIPPPPNTCGAQYTYQWSSGETTPTIQVKCPATSQGYSVEVTDSTGCKTKATYTIRRCP